MRVYFDVVKTTESYYNPAANIQPHHYIASYPSRRVFFEFPLLNRTPDGTTDIDKNFIIRLVRGNRRNQLIIIELKNYRMNATISVIYISMKAKLYGSQVAYFDICTIFYFLSGRNEFQISEID